MISLDPEMVKLAQHGFTSRDSAWIYQTKLKTIQKWAHEELKTDISWLCLSIHHSKKNYRCQITLKSIQRFTFPKVQLEPKQEPEEVLQRQYIYSCQ